MIVDRVVGALLLAGEFWWLLRYDNAVALGSEWAVVVFVVGIIVVIAALGVIRSREWALNVCFQFYVLATLPGIAGMMGTDDPIAIRLTFPLVPAAIACYCRWRLRNGDFG